jgi:hypothetical protein
MNAIISAPELASDLAGPNPPVVLDIRWQLGGPNLRSAYEEAHIPGAVYVDLDSELAARPERRAAIRCPTWRSSERPCGRPGCPRTGRDRVRRRARLGRRASLVAAALDGSSVGACA